MTVAELLALFPEIPSNLAAEPALAAYAEACGDLLARARKPSPCTVRHEPEHVLYMKLVSPLAIYGMGFLKREKLLAQIGEWTARCREDAEAFENGLLPGSPSSRECRRHAFDG